MDTLFIPFERDIISFQKKTLFLGTDYHERLRDFPDLDCYQYLKPPVDKLEANGFNLLKDISEKYDQVLCLLPKQAVEAKYMIATAIKALNQSGIIVLCAANEAGGSRIPGWMKEAGLKPESLSKNKCRVCWAENQAVDFNVINQWLKNGEKQEVGIEEQIFLSIPGLFSWNEADTGSKLLIHCLPPDIKGICADFGCGYGYLSFNLLEKNPDIEVLHIIDADLRAVDCSTENLKNISHKADIFPYWMDLSRPSVSLPKFDFIIMNPPFHAGKNQDMTLGIQFIKNAHAHLKDRGQLFMVANRHLPYERDLKKLFKTVECLSEEQAFKVFSATK